MPKTPAGASPPGFFHSAPSMGAHLRVQVSLLAGHRSTQHEQITKLASVNQMLVKDLMIQKAIADGQVTKGQFGCKPSEPDPLNSTPKPP